MLMLFIVASPFIVAVGIIVFHVWRRHEEKKALAKKLEAFHNLVRSNR